MKKQVMLGFLVGSIFLLSNLKAAEEMEVIREVGKRDKGTVWTRGEFNDRSRFNEQGTAQSFAIPVEWNKTSFPLVLSDGSMLSQQQAIANGQAMWGKLSVSDCSNWINWIGNGSILFDIQTAKNDFINNWTGIDPDHRTTLQAIGLLAPHIASTMYIIINKPVKNAPQGSFSGMWLYTNLCMYSYLADASSKMPAAVQQAANNIVNGLLSLLSPVITKVSVSSDTQPSLISLVMVDSLNNYIKEGQLKIKTDVNSRPIITLAGSQLSGLSSSDIDQINARLAKGDLITVDKNNIVIVQNNPLYPSYSNFNKVVSRPAALNIGDTALEAYYPTEGSDDADKDGIS